MTIVYKDKEYKTLSSLYRELKDTLNITYHCVWRRLKAGYRIEDAFTNDNLRLVPCKDENGNKFKSLKDASKFYKISTTLIQYRLNKGTPLFKEKHRKYYNVTK